LPFVICTLIHRHTGGLEIELQGALDFQAIHRHTGGLEKEQTTLFCIEIIHRHTGGLEKLMPK